MIEIEKFNLFGKPFGAGHPAFVVAEIGFNHNGDVELAKRMIKSAAENGADAVKLQTFIASEMISNTLMGDDPDHPGNEIPFYEFFQRYELSREDYKALFAYARTLNIPLFSTPFDDVSLEMLVELGVPALKIASSDLTYTPFLERIAKTGLPVVLSTGMGSEEEVDQALQALSKAKAIVLLHCVSNYPSQYEEMNLHCLDGLRQRFALPVGLSDHTLGNLSAVVAASLGAVMIEKHFTLDRKMPGVDQSISMEPEDLRQLKQDVLNVTKTLGEGKKEIQESEIPVRQSSRRSLVARVDVPKGTLLELNMLSCKRPGTGISPHELDGLLGKPAKVCISAEQVLTWEMF
jgi:N-acetylneuraminate synthase/N,N'-diacetyllegionaminate synthase